MVADARATVRVGTVMNMVRGKATIKAPSTTMKVVTREVMDVSVRRGSTLGRLMKGVMVATMMTKTNGIGVAMKKVMAMKMMTVDAIDTTTAIITVIITIGLIPGIEIVRRPGACQPLQNETSVEYLDVGISGKLNTLPIWFSWDLK